MVKHLNIQVFGRVQGVFFRHFTQKTAKNLRLTGFIINEPDGSVYIETEGEEALVDKFLKWCHHGPKWAKVDLVKSEEGKVKGYSDFSIR